LGFRFDSYELPAWSEKSIYDSISANIKEDTRVVIINSPGNPGGNIITEEEIQKVEELCIERDIFLLVDEVYRYFGNKELPVAHNWDEVGKNTLLVSSVTKIFGLPGLRLGWIYTENDIMNEIIAAHQSITAISPGMSQQLIAHFPEHDYKGWLQENRDKTIQNRLNLMKILDSYNLDYIKPEGAFYLMLKIPKTVLEKMDDIETAFKLKDEFSILLVPGSAFGKNANGYMRLSFGGSGDDFPEAVKRINDGFKSIMAKV
ncbi:MAG: pyridoxal phosphate-dependent aminotransferase, partial [Candidatus Marinimicrobia bacterium]|nr:pyridoxal phosphate-dependent aminotransferase [Candidatus Neomarinimicrobiota bacterium]